MTYVELLDADWSDIKDKITKEDKLKLEEIDEASVVIIKSIIPNDYIIMRAELRNWCVSKDREQKLNELL